MVGITISMRCSVCGHQIRLYITDEEIRRAQNGLKMIKKAITHTDHVVTLHIDGRGRVRREYATELVQRRPFESWFSTFS
ncbi:MAG: hypothetical protein ACFFC7_20500 [Candidatus Hermodarchaeota archaeon]